MSLFIVFSCSLDKMRLECSNFVSVCVFGKSALSPACRNNSLLKEGSYIFLWCSVPSSLELGALDIPYVLCVPCYCGNSPFLCGNPWCIVCFSPFISGASPSYRPWMAAVSFALYFLSTLLILSNMPLLYLCGVRCAGVQVVFWVIYFVEC